jgi:predicted permease
MGWATRIRNLGRRERVDAEIDAELRSHIQMAVEEAVHSGIPEAEARRAARLRFGNPVVMREKTTAADAALGIDGLGRDFRYALRQMRRSPGFAVSVVATLTLAIGVNTAVFSLLDGFLLRKLPYAEPDRVAALITHEEGISSRSGRFVRQDDDGTDTATWRAIEANVTAATVAAYGDQFGLADGVNLDAGSAGNHAALYVHSARISEHYFQVLGIRPYLGRGFSADEDRAGGPNAAVLSYDLWRTVFHENKGILGQAIEVKGEPFTVVGVLPAGAVTPQPAQIWVPVRASDPAGVCGGGDNCGVLMRLKPGATWQQVAAQLAHLPRADYMDPGYQAWFYARPLQQYATSDMRPRVEVLMLAVSLILLIACGNLAGLTLVRITERRQEIATRMALGASRMIVLRQIWVESLVLGLLGSGAGVCVAVLILTGLQRLLPVWMIPAGGLALDWRVLGFALAAALATSLLFGVLPAMTTRRVNLQASLASSSRSVSGGAGRLRRILIGAEVALTVVLLAAAGLLVRTLVHLETLPPGFDPHNVMTAKASLNDARYRDPAAFRSLLSESIAAMKRIPGVEDAAAGLSAPYERGLNTGVTLTDGPLSGTNAARTGSSGTYVTPDYFRVLRIATLAGRTVKDSDTPTSEPVAVVNQAFARSFFHETNAVGQHFRIGGSAKDVVAIVGVVADVVKEPGEHPDAPLATEPVFYIPAAQVRDPADWHVWFQPSWIVRTRGPVPELTQSMQKALTSVDPELPVSGFYSMDQLMDHELQTQRIEVLLMGSLALLALLLSALGIYALVSNLVVQRTREIGIRLALGCSLSEAIRHIASSGLMAACGGAAVGLVASFFALRVMKSAIYGVQPYDPVTLTVVPLLLLAITGLAGLLPALRITRIDPATTLRAE